MHRLLVILFIILLYAQKNIFKTDYLAKYNKKKITGKMQFWNYGIQFWNRLFF